jgi:cytochrome P450
MIEAESVNGKLAGDPDPYPNYQWLREHAPVSPLYSPYGVGRTWLVTSYELARACLSDPRLSNDSRKARTGPDHGEDEATARGLLELDRPEHARLRRMVSHAFSPQATARWRPMIERECHAAIDRFAGRTEADIVADFAVPVPVNVIHEVLGIPPGERKDATRTFDLFFRAGLAQPNDPDAYQELLGYVDFLIGYKQQHRGNDVMSLLLENYDRGDIRGIRELRSMVLGIFGAGHVTTVQFFGAVTLRLLEHPDQLGELMAGRVRWPDAMNEALRFDSPIQATQHRYATDDMLIGDTQITRGDAVLVSVAAANRDPARFEDPGQFSIHRTARSNLAFGHGVHLCLGAHLARLEGEVGLAILFRRLPGIRLAVPPEQIAWAYGPMLRGPLQLPVTLTS